MSWDMDPSMEWIKALLQYPWWVMMGIQPMGLLPWNWKTFISMLRKHQLMSFPSDCQLRHRAHTLRKNSKGAYKPWKMSVCRHTHTHTQKQQQSQKEQPEGHSSSCQPVPQTQTKTHGDQFVQRKAKWPIQISDQNSQLQCDSIFFLFNAQTPKVDMSPMTPTSFLAWAIKVSLVTCSYVFFPPIPRNNSS